MGRTTWRWPCLDEGAELRRAGISLPILILGHTPPELAAEVVELGLTQTVFTPELAGALSQAAGAAGTRARVHIKLDTGMSRLGILAYHPERAAREAAALCALPHLEAEGIFTHFANADGDEGYTMLQFTRFLDVLAELENKYRLQFAIRHCAASSRCVTLSLYPSGHGPARRGTLRPLSRPLLPGAGRPRPAAGDGLQDPGGRSAVPARQHSGELWLHRAHGRGGRPGGGAAVGYADGLHRVLSNKGSVWLAGKARPILGRVCMDMCMVALDDDAQVEPGDEAEIFGPHLPAEDQAELAGTIQYELLCAVSPRVPRVYV